METKSEVPDCGEEKDGRMRPSSSSRAKVSCQPLTCPLLLAIYTALARSIDAFNSSLCQSPSVSFVHPVVVAGAENGSANEVTELEGPGNVEVIGDPYAGGPEGEASFELPRMVWNGMLGRARFLLGDERLLCPNLDEVEDPSPPSESSQRPDPSSTSSSFESLITTTSFPRAFFPSSTNWEIRSPIQSIYGNTVHFISKTCT